MAAPRITFVSLGNGNSQQIKMKIGDPLQQVIVSINENGLIPTLEQMLD